jgi:hypothetical protein
MKWVEPVGPFAGKKLKQTFFRFQRAQPAQPAKPANLFAFLLTSLDEMVR